MRRHLALAWAALTATVCAQEDRRLEAAVTAVSGGSVYVDRGRSDGIEPGDVLVLLPPGRGPVSTTVRSTSRSSARADLPADPTGIEPGIRAEITLPAGRGDAPTQPSPSAATNHTAPAHPPWTEQVGEWDPERPLLAPAFGRTAAERPTRVGGRAFAGVDHTWDDGRRYLLARTGVDLRIENPLHRGGELHFRGEVDARGTYLNDAPDSENAHARIDRASYVWGEARDAPVRVEVGRFVHGAVPELGLIDGVELGVRAGDGVISVAAGAAPEPFPVRQTGEDLQAAVAYRYAPDGDGGTSATIAYQKTWHRGAPDRDLLLGDLALRPAERLRVQATAWVDLYGGSDPVKGSGVELTELHARASYDLSDSDGVSLRYSHIRWPELKRDEFRPLPPDLLRDTRVTRIGAGTWHKLSRAVRVDLRGDWWQDQDDDGASGDVRLGLRDVLWDQGDLSLTLFAVAGRFHDGSGARASASRAFGPHRVSLRYEWASYDQRRFSGRGDRLVDQSAGVHVDLALSADTYLVGDGTWRFGDSQDSFHLGMFVQVRF